MKKREHGSNRIEIDLWEINFDKLIRVGVKVQDLLARKVKNPIHVYLLLKLLCLSFEEYVGFRLEPKEESVLRRMLIEDSTD